MRYRRFSYSRTLLVSTSRPQPLHEIRRVERMGVQAAPTWWRPAADLYETPGAITVMVDLAGVDHEELDVVLYQDAVVLQGQRRLPDMEPGGVFHVAEIPQGPFRLELPLPATIDPERADARYERGVLRMTFPKSEGR